MSKYPVLLLCLLSLSDCLQAQEDIPNDFLSPAFHAGRREALRKRMPEHSVAVVFAYPVRNFSNDVDYSYHPNPDLYYFTGYSEPQSLLLIFKEPQPIGNKTYLELFFVQEKNPKQEQWTGRRLGTAGVQAVLGFDTAFNGRQFAGFAIDFSRFDKILFGGIPEGIIDDPSNPADLFDLAESFKKKAGIPEDFDQALINLLGQIRNYTLPENLVSIQTWVRGNLKQDEKKLNSPYIQSFLQCKDSVELKKWKESLDKEKISLSTYSDLVASLRQIKTPEEMELIRKSVSISSIAHAEVMKAIRPGMSEREVQGIHEYIHKRYGAENVGYPSIVGAGNNGCILHYEENEKQHIGNDLLLMDVGAEYHGYSADVTRTIPASGKFSPEQKAIYDLVYDAQEAVFSLCREGTPIKLLNEKAREVLARGMQKLGIIKEMDEIDTYYPHGCSHFLGLDVHDAGDYSGQLKENMVITVEPGIYIPENSACDPKWWKIGVRIEDDVRIGKDRFELLSFQAPRKSSDIEKTIALKSALEDFILPPLQTGKKAF